MTKDEKWIHDHFSDLVEKYAGKYIAVVEDKLVAVGDSAKEVKEIGKRKYPKAILSILNVPREEDFICLL